MTAVACTIVEVDIDNEDGYSVESVCARCSVCGHETESFGTSDASIRRCLVLMRQECPQGKRNFYVEADE